MYVAFQPLNIDRYATECRPSARNTQQQGHGWAYKKTGLQSVLLRDYNLILLVPAVFSARCHVQNTWRRTICVLNKCCTLCTYVCNAKVMTPDSGKKTVLVTGGAGFIGSWVADTLLARGDDVVIVDEVGLQSYLG